MNIFKRKPKHEREYSKELKILVNFIKEARKIGLEDKDIKEKFKQKNTPGELIKLAFKKVERRSNTKMPKDTEEYDEEDFEDEDEDLEQEEQETDEDPTDEEEEVEEEKPKKAKKKKSSTKKKEEEQPKVLTPEQVTQFLQNVAVKSNETDRRLENIEATLFRLKGSI